MNLEESLEITPGVFKRLGDCTGAEIESAIRVIARARIDRAWVGEQASGSEHNELTIGRRFFANVTEQERDLIAYWQMVKLVEAERLRQLEEGDSQGSEETSAGGLAAKRLIDQALAAVVAADSLEPGDRSSLTQDQALVWAIYLRAIARRRGLASEAEVQDSVDAARDGGISSADIEAALAAADRPEAHEEE